MIEVSVCESTVKDQEKDLISDYSMCQTKKYWEAVVDYFDHDPKRIANFLYKLDDEARDEKSGFFSKNGDYKKFMDEIDPGLAGKVQEYV